MRELLFHAPGRLAWHDTSEPALQGPAEALVRPLAVARCDLDAAVWRGEAPFHGALLHWLRNHLPEGIGQRGLFRNAPFKGPYPFGHECVAEVLALGPEVRSVAVGDRVVVPFQISCGHCAMCRRGMTADCSSVPARSMYGFGALGGLGWGGALSDVLRVPFADAMLLPLPRGVDPVSAASASDNIADAWRCVGPQLEREPGAPVLVVGGGAASIGLYAVAIARALGSTEVTYIDRDRDRLERAAELGADVRLFPVRGALRERAPITVDGSADPEGLAFALRATAPGGECTSVGIYYREPTPIPLLSMYGIGLRFATGRVHSRSVLPAVLDLLASKRLDPARIGVRVAPWNDAIAAMPDPAPKLILAR
jgi:alcohol dehydrogenase